MSKDVIVLVVEFEERRLLDFKNQTDLIPRIPPGDPSRDDIVRAKLFLNALENGLRRVFIEVAADESTHVVVKLSAYRRQRNASQFDLLDRVPGVHVRFMFGIAARFAEFKNKLDMAGIRAGRLP